MLELKDIKDKHDKSYSANQTTRQNASDDMVFYWITQWDDNTLGDSSLAFKGQFDVLRKAGRQIVADLRANPVQVDFEPKAESRKDGGDLIDGLYRSDDRVNTTIESYDNAVGEAVVCGVGAWELYTEYETSRGGNSNQVIRRRPLYEANNKVFWDPNAKRLDKSDAKYCSVLEAYSEDGYIDLVKDLTGEEIDSINASSFATPEQSYTFPWIGGQDKVIYVVTFYWREKVKDKILTMIDPLGQTIQLRESDLVKAGVMDDLIDEGYTIENEKKIERWQVTRYIASGAEILESAPIAGEYIPVVPTYGERSFVEDEEHYEGITRLAKDPQRLRNFQMSYLADIVSRSPRPKPIFNPEQILGFEFMYEENGADNNYPYLLQNRVDKDGMPLTVGPVAIMPEQTMPSALATSIDLSRQAIEDVAPTGGLENILDSDLSGKAFNAMQRQLDQNSVVYQQNLKHAKRRDAEIYASMASDVYDSPRSVTLTMADGTTKDAQVMESVMDKETGEMTTLNDVTNVEFEVFATIGESYSTKKEQTLEQLGQMAAAVASTDPAMQKALILKQLTFIDGVDMKDIREYANKQLVMSGFKQPETEEEEAMLAEASQNQQPDAMMVAAKAEEKKGDAAIAETQRKAQNDMITAQNNQMKTQVDTFRAQTDRMAVQVDAQEAGATIELKQVQRVGYQLDNMQKVVSPLRTRVNAPY